LSFFDRAPVRRVEFGAADFIEFQDALDRRCVVEDERVQRARRCDLVAAAGVLGLLQLHG